MEHPVGVRLLLLMGFLVGLAPFSLSSILEGRPEFSWFSGGVIFALLNILGEGFVCYVGLAGTSDQTLGDQVPMEVTSTDKIASNLQMMTAHLGYILAVLLMLKEGKQVMKTFEMASQLATAAGSETFVGTNSAPCRGWRKMLTGFPQCLWMAFAGSMVAYGTLKSEAIQPGWKYFAMMLISGKTLGAVFFICATIWYFSDCARNGFSALMKNAEQLLSHAPNREDREGSLGRLQGTVYLDTRAALVDQEVPVLHEVYTLAGSLCDQFSRSHGHMILVNCSAHLIIVTINLYFFIALVPGLIQAGLASSNGSEPSNAVIVTLFGSVLAIRILSLTLGCIAGHGVISQDEEFRAAMKQLLLEDIGKLSGGMVGGDFLAKNNGVHKTTWANKVLYNQELPKNATDERDTVGMTSYNHNPQGYYFKRYSMKTRQLLKDIVNTKGLTIHASGYYSLEKGTVVAIVNVIATYVIILVQFRQADPVGGGQGSDAAAGGRK